MGQRQKLHDTLVNLIETNAVYFQAPPNIDMDYPCIVYKRDDIDVRWANNFPYSRKNRYQVTVIDRDPDSDLPDRMLSLQLCDFDRSYVTDGLYHNVFTLFF